MASKRTEKLFQCLEMEIGYSKIKMMKGKNKMIENFESKLEDYAKLILQRGLNLQKKQELIIEAPIETKDFVKLIYKKALEMGSGYIHVFWIYEDLFPIFLEQADDELLVQFPKWDIDAYMDLTEKGAAMLMILADDPNLLENSDHEKLARRMKQSRIVKADFLKRISNFEFRLNVMSVPGIAWAKQVFKDLNESEAMEKLWSYLFKISGVDTGDAVSTWDQHVSTLKEKCNFLNEMAFEKLHYYSEKTDLMVELVKDHIWEGGVLRDQKGVEYIINIPAEEVFTMPKKDGVNGKLYSTKPLPYWGTLITDMEFTYKNGRVVDYHASSGLEMLASLFDADEGANYLGEVALVPHDSPISNLETIFYNGAIDENASCHFAFGSAYPSTVKGGIKMNAEELSHIGANQSITHVDFMVGSSDLNIDGIKVNGEVVPIFRNGNWA